LRAVQLSFAERLDVTAGALSERYPDDAEKYWDESIELWRKVCGPTPRVRNTAALFVRALLGQSRLLRHRARHESSANSSAPASDRILKAESLYQEALTHQRSNISRFQLVADRFQLVDLLREEAQYLLDNLPKMTNAADSPNGDQPRRRPEPRTASPAELQADSCLTEAIQFCRALATEFPDNADYKNRLDALLKLQAQHFGQQPESKSEKVPNK